MKDGFRRSSGTLRLAHLAVMAFVLMLGVAGQAIGADNNLLHNSNRFACSDGAYQNQIDCESALETWDPNRRYNGGWGTATGLYGEFTCNTCHAKGSGNIKRITQTVTTPSGTIPGSAQTVTFTSAVDGSADFDESLGNHSVSNKVCEVCHTYNAADPAVASPTGGVRFHGYNMAGATVANQTHQLDSDCIKCHQHKTGFRASCTSCHGNPPINYPADMDTTSNAGAGTGSTTVGAHNVHVNTLGFSDCNTCHTGTAGVGEMPKADGSGDINIGFSAFGSTSGTYTGQAGVSYNGANGTGGLTCNTTYCHGGTLSGTAPVWNTPASGACGTCHKETGATVSALPSGTSHNTHANNQALTCDNCHGSSFGATGHVDGTLSWDVSALPSGSSPTYRGAVSGDTAARAPSVSYGTCANIACHNNVVTPAWNGSATCTTCHGAPPTSGAHGTHYIAKGWSGDASCDNCHPDNTLGHSSVTDATIEVDVALGWSGTTCSTTGVGCHNGNLTPVWTTSGITCTACHTVGGSNSGTVANPASGIHDAARITGRLHDDSFAYGTNGASTGDCITCHTATPTTNSGHFNGTNDSSIGAVDGDGTVVNLAATVGFTDGVVPSCAPNQATGCHIEQWKAATKHTWTRTWHESAGSNDGSECRGCHGTFTQAWNTGVSPVHTTNFDGQADGAELRLNHDHGAGTETEYNQCISCHVYNDALYGTLGWNPTLANNHGNGSIEMHADMNYNTSTNSCANTCHGTEVGSHAVTPDSGWTVTNLAGPALTCTSCHTGSGSGALKVGLASTHVARGNKAGFNTFVGCENCHPQHTGGVLVPNNSTVGISYTAGGRTGFRLGGDATTGATEAEICWNCHNNMTYQATAISEWETNTKQVGAPAGITPFNYGTLSQSNWVGATWNSAQAAFGYKSSTIRSTHSANPSGAPWNGPTAAGVDTVGQIRCSYCHDVHDTAAGVVTGDVAGKPFVRGTWWTNPYREDGAPQVSGTTWTARDWGAVPRGSILNNEYGGYQIDQNNSYPTNNGTAPTKAGSTWTWSNSWTYSGSAGLCALCHGSTVNTLNQFGTAGPNAAWIGNNGHANSAVGGTGTGASNIFRTADRAPSGLTTTGARPDMGYANHGTGVGYGFRGPDGRAFRDIPAMVGIQSGNSTRPYGGTYYSWGASVDAGTTEIKYHNFSCSKCHNPHASRLPRLMITNCLDTKQNTWDDGKVLDVTTSNDNGITMGATAAPDSFNRTWSNTTSAQNCHRLAGTNTAQPAGFGSGWNRVTPWNISTKNPDNGTIP